MLHLESFMWERKFEKKFFKKSHTQTPNGVLLIFKVPFPNGSYRNGVCRALWALCMISEIKVLFVRILKYLVFLYFYIVSFWLPIWYVVDLARQSSKPPETWFCHGSWFRKISFAGFLPASSIYYLSCISFLLLLDSVKVIS